MSDILACPRCGSRSIVFLGYGDRWICLACNKPFTEEECKATLTSKEGGFLVDKQMITGGRPT